MDQIIFDSKKKSDYLNIRAPYYNAINPTTVIFQNEQISAFVNSLGHIEFFDHENHTLGCVDLPAAKSPDMYGHLGQYGEVRCGSDGSTIRFELPVYTWEDSYPHCDGEYDRWSRYVIRWFRVEFDYHSSKITVIDYRLTN